MLLLPVLASKMDQVTAYLGQLLSGENRPQEINGK
jgi:hypothetical protein